VPETEIREVLGVSPGGSLPKSKGDAEERLTTIENVVAAHLEAACCDDAGKAILYVGVEERGAPHFDYHAYPENESIAIPEPVRKAYREFLEAARSAARGGATEDLSEGYSLLSDAKARYHQVGFVGLAEKHGEALRKALRESSDPEDRAISAYVLGYSKDRKAAHDDLQYALRDPDETVRANALRALAALAVFARKRPDSGLRVSPTWMIEMLNSLVWTDRNNAAVALVTLTEDRDPDTLQQIRSRALDSLLEMAQWKHLPHALPAFIITGRIAGLTEDQLQAAWNKEDRASVIRRASGKR
jgi:hypothetical protein